MVRHEWEAQTDGIVPSSMPVYSILVTAIDKSSPDDRQGILSELTPYIDGDLVFYHAPDPIGLTQYQANLWGDAIDTFENKYKIRPNITHDLTALRQSTAYHDVILDFINTLSDIEFTVFHILVSSVGSPLVACLAIQNIYNADEIVNIMNAESDFYHKHYKFKDEDISPDERKKNELLQRDIIACMAIIRTLKI